MPITAHASIQKMNLEINKTTYIRTNQTTKKTKVQTITLKNLPSNYIVEWNSSASRIAKVKPQKESGKATLTTYLGEKGSVTITATVRNKETNDGIMSYSKKVTVKQGATGVRIVNKKGKKIAKARVTLNKTLKLYSKVLPQDVNVKSHKKVTWTLTAANKKFASIKNSNVLQPKQKKLIGKGNKTITVNLNGCKTGKKFKKTLKVTIYGGEFEVDTYANPQELTIKVGLDITGDMSKVKGSTITLTGISENVLNKKLKADYIGTDNNNKAIFKLRDTNGNLTDGSGAYNGSYKISSSRSGSIFNKADVSISQPLKKNMEDFAILYNIIKQQKENGAIVSENPYDKSYVWDEKTGKLTGITWINQGLTGDLDVSGLTALTMLSCSNNKLSSLDASGLASLTELDCDDNKLSNLNLSGLANLNILYCFENELSSLNVSELTNLSFLNCYSNELTNLDVSRLANLTGLVCDNNKLSSLDVSMLTKLDLLDCSNNKLISLDVSKQKALRMLECAGNELTNLDVSMLTSLEYLTCSNNKLADLNVSGLKNLKGLYCSGNKLTTLNLSGLTKLRSLNCADNELTTLDVRGLTKLMDEEFIYDEDVEIIYE